MPHRYLLLLLAALLATPALAQPNTEALDSRLVKQRLRETYLHNDTAQALINLYGKRQAGGAGWIVSAALAAARIATAAPSRTTTNYGYGSTTTSADNGNVGAVAFLVAAPIAAYGVGKIVHYSNGHLEKLLTAYAAGQPLPRSVRRKLKPRFFQEAVVKYQRVPVKNIEVKPAK